MFKQRHSCSRLGTHRAATPLLFVVTMLCSSSVVADGWTSPALIGNIQSASSGTPSSGATTHYFRSGSSNTFTVTNGDGICSTPLFAYVDSSQYGYRELLATAMFAKSLGKQVQFVGNCTGPDYFKTYYVILLD